MTQKATWGKRWLGIGVFMSSLIGPGFSSFAQVTPEQLSRELRTAFSGEESTPTPRMELQEKKYVGFTTRTLEFSVGPRLYRVVFSSSGTVTISMLGKGAIAAQPIWQGNAKRVSLQEIVNVIYAREFGRKYRPGQRRKVKEGPERDSAPTLLSRSPRKGDLLRWNRLANRVLGGDILKVSDQASSSSDLDRSLGLSQMLDPCSAGQQAAPQPQRSALKEVMGAMATLGFPGGGGGRGKADLLADRSRRFKKKGKYAFLDDLKTYEQRAEPDETFRLLKQNGNNTRKLFRAALKKADDRSRDPFSLAALRNFRSMARELSKKEREALAQEVTAKIVVDIEAFLTLRNSVPKSFVIYDAISDRFYVDPTLTSPKEAQYALSLAMFYAWQLRKPRTVKALRDFSNTKEKINLIKYAILHENDRKQLHSLQQKAKNLALTLYQISETIYRTAAIPRI